MAFFTNQASKLERAVRALVSLQLNSGSYVITDAFIGNDSRPRVLPNRTFVARAFTPTKPYRPEGVVTLEIQHHYPAIVQPAFATDLDTQRVLLETYFGQTMDVLNLGGTNDQDMQPLATAITSAGRWLAVSDGTAAGIQIATDNADMANFRCDWVKFGQPAITRGKPETESVNWVEIVHLSAFVSNATS